VAGETFNTNNDGMIGGKSICPSTAFTEIFSGKKKFQQLGNLFLQRMALLGTYSTIGQVEVGLLLRRYGTAYSS
jgi:hypothetical protein